MLSIAISKGYSDFSLTVEVDCAYPVTAVFGPSGSGKTTLLNVIAGLERADSGRISLNDRVLFDLSQRIHHPPEQRGIGYVFQDALLFPHLDVAQNLAFAPSLRREVSAITEDRVVDMMDLGYLLERSPKDLSGGERQRVALGRALLSSPNLLLLDEPLASLDTGLKNRIIPYLRHIRDDLGIPMVYVSHSVGEILQLTGQVIVLNRGDVVASGDFFDLAHHPDVFPLLGEFGFENVLNVTVAEHRAEQSVSVATYRDQTLKIPLAEGVPAGSDVFVGIRANDVILSNCAPEGVSIRNALRGRVADIRDVHGMRLVSIDVGKRLIAEVTAEAVQELGIREGGDVYCLIKTHSIRLAQ